MDSAKHTPWVSLGSSSGRSFVRFRFSRRAILNVVLSLLAVATTTFAATWGAKKFFPQPQGTIGTSYPLRPGPWGAITVRPILIEAPSSQLSVNSRLGDGSWYFRASKPEEVSALLRDAGLTYEQTAEVTARLQRVEGRGDLLAAAPPKHIVRALSPGTRSVLYDRLAAVPENHAQVEPFRTTDLHLDDWLDPNKLPPELIAEVRGLLWRRGSGLFFSDYNMVTDGIASPTEKIELLKSLTHKSTVILTLHVPDSEGLDALVEYYGVNGRREKIEPVLKALSEAGGGDIDLSNLLPQFARARLYRFTEALPDSFLGPACHWTTLNFFAKGEPDASLDSVDNIKKALIENYEEVAGEPRFGDAVLLALPDQRVIHSATYIADDIVYTKNGASTASPFQFSTIADMLAFYPASRSIHLAYYRLKGT